MDLFSFQNAKRASQGHHPSLFEALDHRNELSGRVPRVALEGVHV
ncbi:MAG: hypothetical protein ACTSUG_02185 [Candidatus Helarchaeota archaeon]